MYFVVVDTVLLSVGLLLARATASTLMSRVLADSVAVGTRTALIIQDFYIFRLWIQNGSISPASFGSTCIVAVFFPPRQAVRGVQSSRLATLVEAFSNGTQRIFQMTVTLHTAYLPRTVVLYVHGATPCTWLVHGHVPLHPNLEEC